MSSKADKFKGLMRSPSGSQEAKQEMLKPMTQPANPVNQLVQITGKKKATYEMDAELHRWLKLHSITVNRNMVDIIEELVRKYREEQEG